MHVMVQVTHVVSCKNLESMALLLQRKTLVEPVSKANGLAKLIRVEGGRKLHRLPQINLIIKRNGSKMLTKRIVMARYGGTGL